MPNAKAGPKKTKVSERVAAKLISLLEQGHLKAGERLPSEHELMRQLGVGRSSVREAIRGLAVAGILEARPRRGTVVVSSVVNNLSDRLAETVTFWAIKDLYELRGVLEGFSAAAAARRATPDHIAAIGRAHARFIKGARAGRSYHMLNTEYHLNIARAAQNSALVYCLSSIIGSYRETRERMDRVNDAAEDDIADHGQILAAIEARDPARARRLMQAHLRRTIARLVPTDDIRPRPPLPAEAEPPRD
ncbi:MAG TPA: FCD domain-containing protein [Geminicoccaceae bacterium]|nr:FCD domain-containing protein [Geminicoccaceae bacterium]